MKKIRFAIRYIKYFFESVNEHAVHSPFVYDLLMNVIYVKANYYQYKNIEKLREELLDSDRQISFVDFGAGGTKVNVSTKKIKDIARYSAKSDKYGQLLFRLVNHFQPSQVVELGTSLGISAAYLASANSQTKVFTIEGSETVSKIAKQNFDQLQLKNVTQIVGNFNEMLPRMLKSIQKIDFVFFDGNHLKEPTLEYFNMCLQNATENSVFIFDDIYWSDEMMQVWNEIQANGKVTVTIDLFFMGLVFFKRGQAKQHFVIRF